MMQVVVGLLGVILACTSSAWGQAPPEKNETYYAATDNVTLVWQEGEGADTGTAAGNEYRCGVDVCMNGGSCYEKRGLRTCVCPRGYYGRRCQFFNNNVVIDPCPYINSTPTMRSINRGRWAKLSCRYEHKEAVLKCIDGEWVGNKPVCPDPARDQPSDTESDLEQRIEDLERTVNGMMAHTFQLIKRMAMKLESLPVFNANISFPCFGRRCPWDIDAAEDEGSLENDDDDDHGGFFDLFGDDDEDEEDYYGDGDDDESGDSDDDDGFGSTWRRRLGFGRMFRRFGSMAKNFAQERGLLRQWAKDRRRPCADGDCPFLDADDGRPCLNGNCPWADRNEEGTGPRRGEMGMGRGRRMGHGHVHGVGRRGHMMHGKGHGRRWRQE